ncbi:MAG: hypothetical protein RLZZ515_177, partial [Cyanobacteriota bacterium]
MASSTQASDAASSPGAASGVVPPLGEL